MKTQGVLSKYGHPGAPVELGVPGIAKGAVD